MAERICPNTGLRLEPRRDQPPAPGASRSVPPPLPAPAPPVPQAAPKPRPVNEEHKTIQAELIGKTIGGRYLIKGILGEGGMGTVYDAEHLGLSRQVAIKVLSPTQAKKKVAVKRFQQEARAAGAIGHPNICEVYDLGTLDDGSPYLVMERLSGSTLADRIAKEGGMPYADVIDIMTQVLSGLVAAHEKGIIHRDIKPENIFLARRSGAPHIIKLLDFGVSKMMPEFATGDDHLDLTRTGMVMGTPYYMSPEQARGERNLDGRVDVYACGVVLYESIAGKRPFLAPNYNALLLAIINTVPRPLHEYRPNIPPELEAIIRRAMARARDDRYPSAKHFLRELLPPATDSSRRLPPPPTAEERHRAQMLGQAARSRRDTGPTAPPSAAARGRAPEPPTPTSDSIDIPIEVELVVDDHDATSIYNPTPRSGGVTPPPGWPQNPAPPAAAAASRSSRHHDVPPAPPELNGPYIDEAPTTIPPGRSSRRNFNPDETVKLTKSGEGQFKPPSRRR